MAERSKSQAAQVESVAIDSLKPDPRNPRRMAKHEADALKRSLEEYGPVEPAVVNADDTIIGGHMRVEAARELGWTDFPIIRVDLDDEKARLLNLALNRIHGEWDEDKLAEMLWMLQEEDADLLLSGFDSGEIERLLDSVGGSEREVPDPEEPPDDPVTQPGDLIVLGKHRVLCGDARNAEAARPAAVVTDPPYGIGYRDLKGSYAPIRGDDDDPTELVRDALDALGGAGATYLCCDWRSLSAMRDALQGAGREPKAVIVWDKERGVQNLDRYCKQHELILYAGPYGGEKTLRGDVWRIPREPNPGDHPTPKPIELCEYAIQDSTERGDLVADPFLGSGSTLLACERTGRRCYGVEIDPAYCDVIINRWEQFTGQTAERPEKVPA